MIRYLVFVLFVINLTFGVLSKTARHTAQEAQAKKEKYLYDNFDGQDLEKCCDHPGMTLSYEILVKCGKYLITSNAMEEDSIGEGHLCAIQCVLQSYGGFKNGNFTNANFLGQCFKRDADFLGLYKKYYGFCLKRTLKAMKYIPSTQLAGKGKTCSPAPTMLLLCLRSQGFLHCPNNLWTGTDPRCKAIKKSLTEYERSLSIL